MIRLGARSCRLLAPALIVGALACGGGGGNGPYVQTAPPPMRAEVVQAGPGPQHVWVPGYWAWDGTAYAWTPGQWMVPAPGFHTWVPTRWVHSRRGWRMVPGHWR